MKNKKQIDPRQANCTSLVMDAPVILKKEGASDPEADFHIEAYTGASVDRWWGKLAIDVDGILHKEQMPVFRDHSAGNIVGYSTRAYKEDYTLKVDGNFSGVTDAAKEVKGLAGEGFPWQASIGVRPLKIMELEEGAEEEVNGRNIKGPAEIWVESEVMETSFVPLGADSNTSVTTFSKFEEASPGAQHQYKENDTMDLTREKLAKDAPELLSEIQKESRDEGLAQGKKDGEAEGAKNERERIQAVFDQAMPGHEDLTRKLAFDGKTTGPEAAVQILAAERKVRGDASQNLDDDGVTPVDSATPPDTEQDGNLGDDSHLPVEEQAKARWEKDAKLRKEFDSYEAFEAFFKADRSGRVKTISRKDK